MRNLQPVITQLYKSSENRISLDVSDCCVANTGIGRNVGNAVIKINGIAASNQDFSSTDSVLSSARFYTDVPTDLYSFLKDGTALDQTYRITVTSDEGIESDATIIGPQQPVIENILACDADSIYILVRDANTTCDFIKTINKFIINGYSYYCTYEPSKNTSTAKAFKVSAPTELANYKLGTGTLSKDYSIVYTRSDGTASNAYTCAAPQKPTATAHSVITSGSTRYLKFTGSDFTSDTTVKLDGTSKTVIYKSASELWVSGLTSTVLDNIANGKATGGATYNFTFSNTAGSTSYAITCVATPKPTATAHSVITDNGSRYLKFKVVPLSRPRSEKTS